MNLKTIIPVALLIVAIIAAVNWFRDDVRKMISVAEQQKTNAEGLAAMIANDHLMRRIDEKTWAEANVGYLRASATFNAWANYVISSLTSSPGINVVEYRRLLAQANQEGDAWTKWAKLTHSNAVMRAQAGSIPGLPDWVNLPELFNKLMELDRNQRQDLIGRLNACRWRRFEEIPPAQSQ